MATAKRLHRICFLNPHGYVKFPPPLGLTDTGGQTVYEFDLAKALGEKGIKVDIITRHFDKSPEEEEIFPNVKIVRIPCGPFKFMVKENMYEYMPEMMENLMYKIGKTGRRYDLIHSHYWDGGYAGILLAKMLDIPHIHTPHTLGKAKKMDLDIEDLPPQKLKPAYRYHVRIAIEQKIMNTVDALAVLCETTRIQMLQYYLVDFEKIHVIYPGVNSIFSAQKTKFDDGIDFKEHSILTMSRMVPAKGLDRIIEALALLKGKVDFHYYMGGGVMSNDEKSEERVTYNLVQSLIKKYSLGNYVTMLGQVDRDGKLPALYRKASVFILASRYEPFGMTTMESMACGTTPIVSSVAGSRELIVDGLNGFIVNTHDRKKLAEVIGKVLTDDKLRKKVEGNAAFTIKEHYRWEKVVDNYINLYKSLL